MNKANHAKPREEKMCEDICVSGNTGLEYNGINKRCVRVLDYFQTKTVLLHKTLFFKQGCVEFFSIFKIQNF